MPDVLYHYCSADTFAKIVESRSVRLSALSLSNDSMEGKWTQKVFIDALQQRKVQGETFQMLVEASKELPEVYGALGLCLSQHGDKLSQWRGYGDDGYGFCIGFNSVDLRAACGTLAFGGEPAQLVQVEYNPVNQLQRMTDIVAGLQSWWVEIAQSIDLRSVDHFTESFPQLAFERIDKKLPPYLYTMKNPAFEEEAEWRVVSTYAVKTTYQGLSYHASRNKISPYVTLSLGDSERAIAEVIVGPKNITPATVIEGFLMKNASNADVRLSSATYR